MPPSKNKIMAAPSSSFSFHHRASTAADDGDAIAALHSDILQTHILTRLDGAALTSAASASFRFRRLSAEDQLWRRICSASWPSITHPRVRQAISDFPSKHRSFFSDAFPVLDCRWVRCDLDRSSSSYSTSELISAVDIHYKDILLFSKVHSIETETNWFLYSPFRVDLIDPKDSIPSPIRRIEKYEDGVGHLEENLTVSWIVIDPIKNRAANVSSRQAVKVRRHWLSGEIQVQYTTVMGGDGRAGSTAEMVECAVVVSCSEREEDGMEMAVTEVSMQMLDMGGKHLNGKKSLRILGEAMEKGKRIRAKKGEGKFRFIEYEELRRKRKARKDRIENALDMLCVFTGIAILFSFFSFIFFFT